MNMNKIGRFVKVLLLTGAVASLSVSCLNGGSYEEKYQAYVTLEAFRYGLQNGTDFGEDDAVFEIGGAFMTDNNLAYYNAVNDRTNPTDYTGFAISLSVLEKEDDTSGSAASAGLGTRSGENENGNGAGETSDDENQGDGTGEDGSGADEGGTGTGENEPGTGAGETEDVNPFTVNSDSASSGVVFAVFHDNPSLPMAEGNRHIMFMQPYYGTCTPVSCMVNNTKRVADQIAAYNDKNSAQIEVRLTATGYLDGAETGTASILLAGEYEDEKTDTKAYVILDEWTAFDLSGLGNIDSIDFGITVPAGAESAVESYFCLDDFVANINIFIPGE